ncbi:MAG: hypothetical protein Q4D58_05140 [Synergistaceae bacterium]|nr:hypothetical protein [Synergistaceae bacterium]
MIDELFLWIASSFRGETYLNGLRAGGILCGVADIAATALFVRVMDIIKGRPPSKKIYAALAFFLLLTPLQLLPENTTVFFIVMFFVFLPPYLILIYTAAAEARGFVAFVKARLRAGAEGAEASIASKTDSRGDI